jgi:hypothetical protein
MLPALTLSHHPLFSHYHSLSSIIGEYEKLSSSHLLGIECKMRTYDLQAASTRRKRGHRQHLGHLATVFFARLQQKPCGTG